VRELTSKAVSPRRETSKTANNPSAKQSSRLGTRRGVMKEEIRKGGLRERRRYGGPSAFHSNKKKLSELGPPYKKLFGIWPFGP